MWQMRIIRYIPANTSPMIFFDEERLPTKDLYISPDTYLHRKELISERFNSMVEYADNTTICRSVFLQQHFGDHEATPCGICDICLSEKRRRKEQADSVNANDEAMGANDKTAEQILALLREEAYTAREIMRKISCDPSSIAQIIDKLKSDGKISLSHEGKLIINE